MIFLDNLVTDECDLSLGLQSSWDIHILPFIFRHFLGGMVPSSWSQHSHLLRYFPDCYLLGDLPYHSNTQTHQELTHTASLAFSTLFLQPMAYLGLLMVIHRIPIPVAVLHGGHSGVNCLLWCESS